MSKVIIALFLLISIHLSGQGLEGSMHLSDYKNIAIATDLEPDDVLALKIIFQEANALYHKQPENGYPIQLVIVGEGNSAIKKVRMEALLDHYFNVPDTVKVQVKAGQSTTDNPFPYDGRELFSKEILNQYPFPQTEEGTDALIKFVKDSEQPLIIQLKPVQELVALSFMSDLAQKTDVIFYGSFNFRKSLHDPSVVQYFDFASDQPLNTKLQALLDHLGQNFKKVEIIESYGVLGDQSSVYFKFPWSNPIAKHIEQSNDPFYLMFRVLVSNWNQYLLEAQLLDLMTSIDELKAIFPQKQTVLNHIHTQLQDLSDLWDEDKFTSLFDQMTKLMSDLLPTNSTAGQRVLDQLNRDLNFANQIRPGAGIQFTLSDIIVALVLADNSNFFTATPVKIIVNERGFLQTSPESQSNVFYYNRKDHKDFVEILIPKL